MSVDAAREVGDDRAVGEPELRVLSESEYFAANELFRQALLLPATDEETWSAHTRAMMEPGRVLGTFVDGEIAGTALSMTSSLAVPGGAVVPAAAVTGVAVRADATRQGLLTRMMRHQLDDAARRGEVVAMLHASEGGIYERFGYGVACRTRTVEIDRARARMRDSVPRGGRVRLITRERAAEVLPELHETCSVGRAGWMHRPEGWWPARAGVMKKDHVIAVHADESGVDDGFAVYQTRGETTAVDVWDLVAANEVAAVELWRFLLGIDLVTTVAGLGRPVDEPVEWWLADRRACRTTGVDDDLWVRLVDVPAALRARSYGGGARLVLEVTDGFLPANAGRYLIGPDGVTTADESPQLTLDAAALASLHLGDQPASALAAAGLVQVHEPAALAVADQLFQTRRAPWCGTGF